jgi:hypothetical protein
VIALLIVGRGTVSAETCSKPQVRCALGLQAVGERVARAEFNDPRGRLVLAALFKTRILDMLRYTSGLPIDDGVLVDISPASMGSNTLGNNDGHGYAINPVTIPQLAGRGFRGLC